MSENASISQALPKAIVEKSPTSGRVVVGTLTIFGAWAVTFVEILVKLRTPLNSRLKIKITYKEFLRIKKHLFRI
jgi:hypothetical protein